MSDNPPSVAKSPDEAGTATTVTNGSGEVNIDAKGDVNIGGDVVGRDKIIYEAPAPIAISLHQLPPPLRDFTGREAELTELMTMAESEGVAISG